MIRFLQPWWLLALLPVFAVAGFYVWRQFRRRSYAMRFTNVDLLRTLAPKGLGWRRHAAAGAFLLSLVALGSAMARPSVDKKEPLEPRKCLPSGQLWASRKPATAPIVS